MSSIYYALAQGYEQGGVFILSIQLTLLRRQPESEMGFAGPLIFSLAVKICKKW